jgi:ribonuclease HI
LSQGGLFAGRDRVFIINVDGASRGNPGPAAAAWIIRDGRDGVVLLEEGLFLGKETNNRAEYLALLFALEDAHLLKAEAVSVLSDSELLVKQVRGEYRVKNAGLKPLAERVKRLAGAFPAFAIKHVPRKDNREADKVANEVLSEHTRRHRQAQKQTKSADQ